MGGAESRGNKRCLFELQSIEERGFFLFLPKGSEKGEGDRQVPPFTPSCPRGVPLGLPRGGKGFTLLAGLCCLARPALYRAGLVVVGAYAKHLVQQRAGVRRRAVLGRGCARNLFPCLARGLRRALPSDVEGCGGISEAPTFLVLLSHKSTNRPSMRCCMNKYCGLHLLLLCPAFLLSTP